MRHTRIVTLAAAAAVLLRVSIGQAGPLPGDKCEAAKLKAAGKACSCRLGAAARTLITGSPPDFAKCTSGLTESFSSAEAKAVGECPNMAESGAVDATLAAMVGALETTLDSMSAASPAAKKCVAAKLKAAGKHCSCKHKARGVAAIRGTAADYTKCDAKLAAALDKAEAAAAGACPTADDTDSVRGAVDTSFAVVEADIANLGTADFATKGPYGVGIKTFTFVDTSRPTAPNGDYPGAPERTLNVDIWYPADPSVFQPQLASAPLVETGGPFPLIVRAHGFSAFRADSKYVVQHLASHGYIVIAPDFPLSTLLAPGGPTLSDVGEQARDLSFLIDTMTLANADPQDFFFGRIDTDTIGALGHSLGGATVLVASYHTTLRDPRILATVAFSPLACVFLDGFFDTSTVPLMIEGGTIDLITPYTSNQLTPFGYVNAPKYLLELTGGTHLGFADRILFAPGENGDDVVGCSIFVGPGDPRPVVVETDLPPDYLGGSEAGVDPSGSMCEPICPLPPSDHMLQARQNELAKASAVAFFDAKLRGSVSGARMITDKLDSENTDAALFFEE